MAKTEDDAGSSFVVIDPSSIPDRFMIDTGVLIRALEYSDAAIDRRVAVCRALWVTALRSTKATILIPAPSVAEFRIKNQGASVPNTRRSPVVSFDVKAAEYLGEKFRDAVFQSMKGDFSKDAIRYDSLIAACAHSHNAMAMVSLDDKLMRKACDALGVPFRSPFEFVQAERKVSVPVQGSIFDVLDMQIASGTESTTLTAPTSGSAADREPAGETPPTSADQAGTETGKGGVSTSADEAGGGVAVDRAGAPGGQTSAPSPTPSTNAPATAQGTSEAHPGVVKSMHAEQGTTEASGAE